MTSVSLLYSFRILVLSSWIVSQKFYSRYIKPGSLEKGRTPFVEGLNTMVRLSKNCNTDKRELYIKTENESKKFEEMLRN